jgi:multidrug resistance efflux pump
MRLCILTWISVAWLTCCPLREFSFGSGETELVLEGAILKTIDTTSVSAQVAGMIQVLDIKEGLAVEEGQELGRIRDYGVRIQSEKAKASLELAKKKQLNDIDIRLATKNKAVAENEYDRAVQANQLVRNTYPINEIDRLKLIADRSGLEVERAGFAQSVAELEASVSEWEHKQSLELMQRHRIVSPGNGVVVSLEKRKGEWVEPGTVLFKMVQLDVLRVEGFLNAADAIPELVGSQARLVVEDSKGMMETTADLVFITPDVNPVNSQVRVFLEVDNKERKLRPGLRPKVFLKKPS